MTEPTTPTGAPLGAGSATGWTPAPVTAPESTPGSTASAAPTSVTGAVEVISTVPVSEVTVADEIAGLVLAVPGVVELHPGRFGEVATYLPGRRVAGVKLGDETVEIHVVLAYGTPIRAVAQQIHAVVAAVVDVAVQVFVEDLAAAHAA